MRPATSCLRVVLALAVASFGCGDSPTRTTTTTTVPVTTSTVPATTTSTVPPTTTGTITVQNTPCVAAATGPVSCTFVGTGTSGQAPFTYSWVFTTPTSATPAITGSQARPELGCGFSAGVATFNLSIALTISPATGSPATITSTQPITRAAGSCGV